MGTLRFAAVGLVLATLASMLVCIVLITTAGPTWWLAPLLRATAVLTLTACATAILAAGVALVAGNHQQ